VLAGRGAWGGYHRTSLAINRAFNLCLACLILVLALPVIVLVYLVILLRDGRPVFYRGERLGLHKRPFTMYKFRTLVRDADRIIGAQLLTHRHKLVTPIGKFLRDARLDELVQLVNIVRGEMDFVGPRPVRPIIYEKICRHIPNYDRRFSVKPGLIGYAQLFTPHSTPKRIRTMIDNTLLRKKQVMLWDAGIIVYTMVVVVKTTVQLLWRTLYRAVWQVGIRHRYREKRELERVSLRRGRVCFGAGETGNGEFDKTTELMDINEQAFLMRSDKKIESPFPTHFKLQLTSGHPHKRGHRYRSKSALCEGTLYREMKNGESGYSYVVEYTPVSPLNYYKVHQYFLCRSVA